MTAAVVMAAGASLVGFAGSASAVSTSCDVGNVCLYDDSYFNGGIWYRSAYPGTYNLTGFNDRTSSWINNSWSYDARWFWGANATGGSECMSIVSSNGYVGWYNNDEASSVRVYTDDLAC
ncbi:peptidase inhibitor family I36 protein [Streptomyces sp. TLI_235]|uniref:peptidase inhibitor family I36 protein n=1 Tax=Kitasatospora sp. NPDC085879 TaxID=3154769 RepID=UPI00211B9AE6|nr:peptidase inhibitor family I36 protein [Streptomyces sp. TLI_235]